MLAFQRFDQGAAVVLQGGLNTFPPSNYTFKLLLSNVKPALSATVKADITQIAGINGYTTNGQALACSLVLANPAKLVCDKVTWTAAGGAMVFQYIVLWQNVTDVLLGYWDCVLPVTLPDTKNFTFRAGGLDAGGPLVVVSW